MSGKISRLSKNKSSTNIGSSCFVVVLVVVVVAVMVVVVVVVLDLLLLFRYCIEQKMKWIKLNTIGR